MSGRAGDDCGGDFDADEDFRTVWGSVAEISKDLCSAHVKVPREKLGLAILRICSSRSMLLGRRRASKYLPIMEALLDHALYCWAFAAPPNCWGRPCCLLCLRLVDDGELVSAEVIPPSWSPPQANPAATSPFLCVGCDLLAGRWRAHVLCKDASQACDDCAQDEKEEHDETFVHGQLSRFVSLLCLKALSRPSAHLRNASWADISLNVQLPEHQLRFTHLRRLREQILPPWTAPSSKWGSGVPPSWPARVVGRSTWNGIVHGSSPSAASKGGGSKDPDLSRTDDDNPSADDSPFWGVHPRLAAHTVVSFGQIAVLCPWDATTRSELDHLLGRVSGAVVVRCEERTDDLKGMLDSGLTTGPRDTDPHRGADQAGAAPTVEEYVGYLDELLQPSSLNDSERAHVLRDLSVAMMQEADPGTVLHVDPRGKFVAHIGTAFGTGSERVLQWVPVAASPLTEADIRRLLSVCESAQEHSIARSAKTIQDFIDSQDQWQVVSAVHNHQLKLRGFVAEQRPTHVRVPLTTLGDTSSSVKGVRFRGYSSRVTLRGGKEEFS